MNEPPEDDHRVESSRPSPPGEPATAQVDEAGAGSIMDTARGLWRDDRIEIVATILLAMSVVLSAWGAYQATRWSGEQANSYAESAALRASAGRHGTVASRQVQVDVATFIAWSQAASQEDERLKTFLRARFRPEFVPAFDAWLTSGTVDGFGLPAGTPFELPTYVVAEQVQSDQLVAEADRALADAQAANQISDNFVLTAVLFASVLFFAGTAAKFRPQPIRWSMIAAAAVVFVVGLAVEFSLPQNVAF